ncbi:pentapeptide repeat-containing protein [Natronoarchaeum sp. GCM10025703]|uniref:pentapeptide repeat-containing protein n=1 Tax=Natronoarchaeum sp. GCM10025703 TaxID=3252685 RepID=UPI00360FF9CD
MTTNYAEQVPFIIWKQSPAAGLDWTVGEWYRIDEALKQWSETTELNATNRTTAERIPSETVEASIVDSEAVNQSPMAGRCGFTWIPEEQNNTDSCAYCCYRSTWKEFDRCVWHAKTDLRKPSDTLAETREQPENRKLNGSPRELLSGAVLRDAELTDSVLTGVDFSGSDFRNTNLNDVYLRYSNLSEADFRGADLTDCTVSKVSFRNANLRKADLRGLSIFGIDFTDAELSEADFREANIKNTDLTGANPEAAKGLVDTENPGGDETTGEVSRQNQNDLSGETHSGKGVSLVHTTNTYLDRKNMGRKERQNDFVSAFKQVVDYACAIEAEALIHSGNLFWSKDPDAWVVKECRRLLKKLKNNQVEFILVRGERDVTRTPDIIQELENKGLLSGPQTGWYQVSDIGIFLYSTGSPPRFEDEHTPPTDATSYLAVLFDDVSTATNGSLPTL